MRASGCLPAFVLLGLLSLETLHGQQEAGVSPSDLIARLSNASNAGAILMITCGETEQDGNEVKAAKSLVRLGAAALPDIEKTLDSLDKEGLESKFSRNAGLVLFAYARIKGPQAYPRLQSMLGNSKLVFLQSAIDSSIAVSLDLTSYVSFRQWTSLPRGPVAICGHPEPRHALDQLILAWEGNDRTLFEASLGAVAKSMLNSLLAGRSWAEMRTDLWHVESDSVALGYRFSGPAKWSRPAMTFENMRDLSGSTEDSANPELDALFVSASGLECTKHRIRFVPAGDLPARYVVDDSDLSGLLRALSSCAGIR